MSSQEGRSPMDRKTAESLLRGDRPVGDPLSAVLAAAKAPATARELSGEADALAAFRAAAHSPDVVPQRRRSMLAKLLTLKVAAAAFACTATVGGVALAASTGALPNPISSNKPSHQPSHSAPASHAPLPSGSARPVPSGSALPGLCREWAAKDRDHRTQSLDDAHFGELVKRAGQKDRDHVERFCGLHKPDPSAKPSTRPSTRPGGKPGLPSGLPKTPQEQQQHG